MLRKALIALGGTLVAAFVLLLVLLRIAFGLALYAIAFGAAYIILVEAGVL